MLSQLPERINFKVIPDFFTQNVPDRQQKMEAWLVSFYFWTRWETREDELEDTKLRMRAIAESKIQALDNALELQQVSEETALSLLVDANQENWYRYAEVNDLYEFLHDKLDQYMETQESQRAQGRNVHLGGISEISSLIKIISLMINLGVPKDKIIPIRHNLSKAREAVKPLTDIANNEELSDKDRRGKMVEILKQVADPDTSVSQFRQSQRGRDLAAVSGRLPIDGMVSVLRDGEFLFIRSPDSSMTRAIQYSLKGLVNGWHVTDAVTLATEITDQISTKDKLKATKIVLEAGKARFVQVGEGQLMPTPERFKDIVMAEIGRSIPLIDQALGKMSQIWLPVYSFGPKHTSGTQAAKYVQDRFMFSSRRENALPYLNTAVQDFYELPNELEKLYKIHQPQIGFSPGYSISIDVIIER